MGGGGGDEKWVGDRVLGGGVGFRWVVGQFGFWVVGGGGRVGWVKGGGVGVGMGMGGAWCVGVV